MKEPDLPLFQSLNTVIPDETELSSARQIVIDLLSPVAVDINEIIRQSNLETAAVLTILLELELAGRIERLIGNRVSFTG